MIEFKFYKKRIRLKKFKIRIKNLNYNFQKYYNKLIYYEDKNKILKVIKINF